MSTSNSKFVIPIFVLLTSFAIIYLTESCTSVDLHQNSEFVTNQKIVPDQIDFTFHVKPILSDRCFTCHGPDTSKVKGDFQLHTETFAKKALDTDHLRYAIVDGSVDSSLMIDRIYSSNPDDIMPPPESNLILEDYEKEILKKWIDQGAEWKEHWAFLPASNPTLPEINDPNWTTNEIDYFILEKLEANNLTPSKQLSDQKLLRKLSFDLRGLPPSIDDINSFASDPSIENYERLVEKYLSSSAFAERMTSDWLDLARYADTHGYQDDLERIMWPWRDWVIHAFNTNMPYDQFVIWQLAGDLLPNASKEQIIATAFNRNHKITQEGGVIPEEYRAEYVTDRTNTFGTAFLGLTFECAKCHDHKYDPISQKEYFQLYGFFNNIAEKGLIENYGAIPEPFITLTQEEIESTLQFINNSDTLDSIPLLVMKEKEEKRTTHILSRGVYDQKGDEVQNNVPSFGQKSSGGKYRDRLDLANWLFDDDNPLTARVTVNRLWQQVFGQGLVSTSYDFGNQGSLPSHPELLDHLAITFRESGWDVKAMMKYFVTSSTYKQESKVNDALLELDPQNALLARSSRVRLSAEMLRDHLLSISGLLVEDVGGPSVKPYQPPGLWNEITGGGGGSTAQYIQDKGKNNYRRSLYTFWKRTVPPPNMLLFDTPTRDFCMVKRENTSTPLQALVLMNDPQFLETSKALASRAFQERATKTEEVVQMMFTLATSRAANDKELDALLELYQGELKHFEENPKQAIAYLNIEADSDDSKNKNALAALSIVANAIMNLDETIRKS